jgi:hypothetical protein
LEREQASSVCRIPNILQSFAFFKERRIPRMNKYYVLRRGSEFKDIFIDESSATLWTKAGWEIAARSFDTREQAQAEMERWKLTLGKKTPQSTPCRSQPNL